MMTAFLMHNCGGLDEGSAAGIAAAFWVINHELGLSLTSKDIGHATPSESLLYDWEKQYAAELFITKCYQMRISGTTCLHSACDHGHRGDQDSLVKGWSYAARNKSGDRTIEFL